MLHVRGANRVQDVLVGAVQNAEMDALEGVGNVPTADHVTAFHRLSTMLLPSPRLGLRYSAHFYAASGSLQW